MGLGSPARLSLDDAIEFLADDELLEVTQGIPAAEEELAKHERDRVMGQLAKEVRLGYNRI